MLNKAPIVVVGVAAVLALVTVAVANKHGEMERFTFVAASSAGASREGRMEIAINRWSPDSERDRLLSVLKTDGPDKLAESFRLGSAAGHISFPGNLVYTIRFAYRMPRTDGGEDVILATDYPVDVWWGPTRAVPPSSVAQGTLIQVQFNMDGRGEGKLSVGTKLGAIHDGQLFGLQDYAEQPVMLTDVQRERSRVTS